MKKKLSSSNAGLKKSLPIKKACTLKKFKIYRCTLLQTHQGSDKGRPGAHWRIDRLFLRID